MHELLIKRYLLLRFLCNLCHQKSVHFNTYGTNLQMQLVRVMNNFEEIRSQALTFYIVVLFNLWNIDILVNKLRLQI